MAEQFPPLSAATLAAANQSAPGWRRTIWRRCPRSPQVDVVSAGRQRRDPNHRRRLPSGGGAAVPLLISGGVGHSTGYLYETVRQDPPLPYVAGGWPPGSACSGRHCS